LLDGFDTISVRFLYDVLCFFQTVVSYSFMISYRRNGKHDDTLEILQGKPRENPFNIPDAVAFYINRPQIRKGDSAA
jgi:hypothetical protein